MKLLSSAAELDTLRGRWLRPGVFTNFFKSGAELEAAVAERRVFVSEEEGAAFVVFREDFCDRLYFFTAFESGAGWRPERLTSCECALRKPEDEAGITAFLKEPGLAPGLRRLRMQRPRGAAPDCGIELFEPEHDIARDFLDRHFDRLFGCVPAVLSRTLAAGGSSGIQGLIHYMRQGTVCEIRHLAVEQDCRGRGVATELIRAMLQRSGGAASRVWLRTDNTAAMKLYEKNGFSPDGRVSVAYCTEGL